MDKLSKLKKDALESCNFRGHTMGEFKDYRGTDTGYTSRAYCTVCQMGVFIIVNPLPNETEISGMAVSVYCKQEKI